LNYPAFLALSDGSIFLGTSIGASGLHSGEVVFNTSMTGYQEILSDPSYARQLVALTYPHIGNTGINSLDMESEIPHVSGLIIRNYSDPSNWRSTGTLRDFLVHNNIVAIADVDTRRLTRLLRKKGALSGALSCGQDASRELALQAARDFSGLESLDLTKGVTCKASYGWKEGPWSLSANEYSIPSHSKYRVVAYDFGIKRNILRLLTNRGCEVEVVPADTTAKEIIERRPNGVFLSNGPGDPKACSYAIKAVREIVDAGIPSFGICLGYQILALACGAQTAKMKFGHHGANHPVKELEGGRVLITSQNHGFSVDETSLPPALSPTHRSLFDGTLQGLEHRYQPAFGFQGHPEGSPGPHDIHSLFDKFISLMKANTTSG
jgi:carbamoyl-phosphate synthase small subunit